MMDYQAKISEYIAGIKAALADRRISWAEAKTTFVGFVALVCDVVGSLSSLTGEQKKAIVVWSVNALADAIAGNVALSSWPAWLLPILAVIGLQVRSPRDVLVDAVVAEIEWIYQTTVKPKTPSVAVVSANTIPGPQ